MEYLTYFIEVSHVECFKYIKDRYPNCHLIVGVVSDTDCESYKIVPIICEDDSRNNMINRLQV